MAQVPEGAEGTVAGVMVYCSICLIASSAMIWLSWTHDERTSYVAMLSYFATLSIAASIVQQIHDVVRYRSLVTEQFEHRKLHPDNPEVAIANGSTGFSLVLYYIQYYCYNVEAMCVMFWAAFLAQSVYGLSTRSRLKTILRRINRGGKIFAVLFPMTTILLLRIPQVQDQFIVFILLADLPLMLSLLCSCTLMLMILARYVHSKRKFLHWSEDAGSSDPNGVTSSIENTTAPGKSAASSSHPNPNHGGGRRHQGMWDRWLMVRFTIAFVALGIFEVTNTLFQLRAVTNAKGDAAARAPDFSAERAKGAWIFFMPGVTPGLFIFIVFGTTTPLRRYMYETLVPRRWQRRYREERKAAAAVAARRGSDIGPPTPPKDNVVTLVELQAYQKPSSSRGHPPMTRPSTKGRLDFGEEAPRGSDSDELPILPIFKHDPRCYKS